MRGPTAVRSLLLDEPIARAIDYAVVDRGEFRSFVQETQRVSRQRDIRLTTAPVGEAAALGLIIQEPGVTSPQIFLSFAVQIRGAGRRADPFVILQPQ